MPLSSLFVQRSLNDSERLTKTALASAGRIAGKLRARILEQMRRGTPLHISDYFVQQLHGLTVTAMLASHLSGMRRFELMLKQTPSLMKRLAAGTLKLSALDDALKVLKVRQGLQPAQLRALEEKYNTDALQILKDAGDKIDQELSQEVARLVQEGAHAREAISALRDKIATLGIDPQKDYVLERIFRTQSAVAFAAGRWQAEQEPDIQEILWGYKYVTVGDDRVRDEHAAIDGVTLPKDDPFWSRFYPPNGWNCRCQVIPIFEQREIVQPPTQTAEGDVVKPDDGFDLNFGKLFAISV